MIGKHEVVSLYGDFTDNKFIYQMFIEASNMGTVLNTNKHEFWPQGLTAIVTLAESHVTIHTYPELNKAYMDVFTCGDQIDPQDILLSFCERVKCAVVQRDLVLR